MTVRHFAVRISLLIALPAFPMAVWAQSLTLIQAPPGYSYAMRPTGISEDGNVVVGHYFGVRFAFRWTPSTGLVTLPPPAGNTLAYATGVSLDGSVVVGHTSTEDLSTNRGMRWTQAGGSVAFGPTAVEQFMAVEGCDGSGQKVFGSLGVGQVHYGYVWTLSQPNPTYLPLIPGGNDARVLAMASNPEQSKVGSTGIAPLFPQATLWENNAATNLWPGQPSLATCISEDGNVIYGHRTDNSGATGPLAWIRYGPNTFGAIQYLGYFLGNRTQAQVRACTAAGSPFTGGAFFGTQFTPSVGDNIAYMVPGSFAMVDLNDWFPSVGIAIPPGVILRDVVAVSNDGTAICGKATTPTGDVAYVARGIPCLNRPILTNGDIGVSYCHGNQIELSVSTDLPYVGTIYYQWYKNNQPLNDGLAPGGSLYYGTQNQTLIVQGSTTQDSGVFHCVAYNACGSHESGMWYLTVHDSPLAAAPLPPEVCPGGNVSIGMNTANVTSFLWEYYSSAFNFWAPFSDGNLVDFGAGIFATVGGATTDTLMLSNTFLGAPLAIRFSGGNPCQIMAPIQTLLNYAAPPLITSHPATTNYCHGQPSSFTVGAASQLPLTYQWQLYHTALQQWINLNDGFYLGGATGLSGTIVGSLTPTITFTLATIGTVSPNQPFRCVLSHGCGSATSNAANLHICIADVNCDGVITSQDFFDFITAFFTNAFLADVNTDNQVTSQDYFDFLTAFFTGC